MDWRNRGFDPDDDRLESLNEALDKLREINLKIEQSKYRMDQLKYDLKFVQILNANSLLEEEEGDDES